MAAAEPRQPNIVFILTDQWRGDCLGAAGHPVVETPNLDMLAAQGALFTRAYSACPSCIAARACLMTGTAPSTNGRLGYQDGVPWRYDTTLMTELGRGGYQCHCVGKTHFYPQRVHLGFDSIESYECLQNHDGPFVNDYYAWLRDQPGGPWDENVHGLDSNSWMARPSPLPEHLHVNSWTVTRAIDFVRRRDPTRPFFLNVSFHRPHPPNDPPEAFFHMYDDAELPPVPMGDWAAEYDEPVAHIATSTGRLPKRQSDRQRRAYFGQISHIDNQIGRLMIYLQRTGLASNTIFVFTSDHGELLGDHCQFRKILSLEGSARLPLVVQAPRRFGLQAGLATDLPVTHMDLMPTLLELAGLPTPGTVDGQSLVPGLRGEQADDAWREFVHGEHARPGHPDGGVQFLVGRRYKYTWYTKSGRQLLFDLVDDPQELVNLAAKAEHADLLADWRRQLAEVLAERPDDGLARGGELVPGKSLPSVRPELLEPYYDNEGRAQPGVVVTRFAYRDEPEALPRGWPLD